jgi:hypothetical protein
VTAGLGRPVASTSGGADLITGLAPLVFGGIFSGFIALVVVLAVRAARRERARQEQLWAHAMRCGWGRVPAGAPLPRPVAEAARSRRSRMVLGTRIDQFDVWLVWHRWTETTGSGDSTTHTTRDLTRYFLWPGRPRPNLRLVRRSRLGASLMPVRGVGTGDAEFDKRFLVRAVHDTAARGVLTPVLRQAMVAGRLPVWEVTDGTLIIGYDDVPSVQTLQYRASVIVDIARMLG